MASHQDIRPAPASHLPAAVHLRGPRPHSGAVEDAHAARLTQGNRTDNTKSCSVEMAVEREEQTTRERATPTTA
ncbi:hypothetical protein CRUP_029064 [Coryphaenoides rupestris]|nr:hypothetical protein CRUP_029064 [Coryphaenoides rupestris]